MEMELSLEQHLLRDAVQSSSSIKKKKGGCTCKKTKCLKMYCECFSSGRQCTDNCNCQGCSNCQEHLDSILKAQKMAKVKEQSKSSRKGCNCRKTHCQKKYCECFNLGVPCN